MNSQMTLRKAKRICENAGYLVEEQKTYKITCFEKKFDKHDCEYAVFHKKGRLNLEIDEDYMVDESWTYDSLDKARYDFNRYRAYSSVHLLKGNKTTRKDADVFLVEYFTLEECDEDGNFERIIDMSSEVKIFMDDNGNFHEA